MRLFSRRRSVDTYRPGDAWEESVFIDERGGKRGSTRTAHMGSSITRRKIFFFAGASSVLFLGMIARIFLLQVVRGESYYASAEGNRIRTVPIVAERGHIYDRNSVQLTKNVPNFSLALRPQELPRNSEEKKRIIARLAALSRQSEQTIEETLETYSAYRFESIVIQENLDYETALSIQIAAADLPGIEIQRGSKRLYLLSDNKSLSHVLGYQGKLTIEELREYHDDGYLPSDVIGKTGLEETYERVLRGAYGTRRLEVDARGEEQSVIEEIPPKPGHHITLHIDSRLQDMLADALSQTIEGYKKPGGAAILIDPKNGAVLALVSLPAFDNNDFSGGISPDAYAGYISDKRRPLFNRAIAGMYPSGSSIKPAIAAGALEEGIITPNTSFDSVGGLRVGVWFFPDWLPGGHGITNVRTSLAWSVNTFYYYIGGGYGNFQGLGIEKIVAYLRQFGFGEALGIDIPNEKRGFLPSKEWKERVKNERWYIGDTYNVSIGQGDVLVTPLQIAAMTAAVANGGTLYRPQIVASTIDAVTKTEDKIAPERVRENVVSPRHLETIRLGMRDCVVYGSCRRLAPLPITIAGKTGTAQWSSTAAPHAWFTSFAPLDTPEIVLTVLVEEGEEGSRTAVAVADTFYRSWLSYKASLAP